MVHLGDGDGALEDGLAIGDGILDGIIQAGDITTTGADIIMEDGDTILVTMDITRAEEIVTTTTDTLLVDIVLMDVIVQDVDPQYLVLEIQVEERVVDIQPTLVDIQLEEEHLQVCQPLVQHQGVLL